MNEAIVALIVLSAIGGFLSGLLGIGGGVIFVPILSFVFEKMGLEGADFSKYVLANSFAIILFASASASIKHLKSKNIKFQYLLFIGLGGILTSLGVAFYISESGRYSKKVFLVMFLVVLILSLLRIMFSNKTGGEVQPSQVKPFKFALIGGFTGIISGFTGVGGGIIMVPAFSNILRIPLKISIGLSSGAIFLFALTNFIQYCVMTPLDLGSKFQLGYVRFDLLIYPLLAVLVFAPIGVAVAQKMNSKVLRGIFVLLLMVIIVKTAMSLFS